MSTTFAAPGFHARWNATAALKAAAAFWFVVLVLGQLMFASSIALMYSMTALRGDMHAWNKRLAHGYVEGDTVGNAALMLHIAAAVLVMLSGAIQFLPSIRRRAPVLHRWNGRLYVGSAMVISLGGLYLLIARGTPTSVVQQIGTGLLGVIVPVCAIMAWRYALKRDFATHRRWAFRLFLTTSTALFIRSGVILSVLIASRGGAVDLTLIKGPVLTAMTFGQYCVPLAILELYFWTQRRGTASARWAMATALAVITLIMASGIAAASVGLFIPNFRTAFDARRSIAVELATTIKSGGVQTAIAQYHRLRTTTPIVYNFDEDELNALGYDLLRAGKYQDAIAIFQLNTETYPHSGNTWDSLAEGYMDNGDTRTAIADYRKSLAINPGNQNAMAMLQKLR
jgi:hypothetical protein